MDKCPQCGARNDDEAARMCKPILDDCPMCGVETTFEARLLFLTMMENWEPTPEELATLAECEAEANSPTGGCTD